MRGLLGVAVFIAVVAILPPVAAAQDPPEPDPDEPQRFEQQVVVSASRD